MTGPAIVNIFAPTPNINPSVLNSTAGAATEAFIIPSLEVVNVLWYDYNILTMR